MARQFIRTRRLDAPRAETDSARDSARRPFCFVTKTGKVVPANIMDQYYSQKAKEKEISQQIREDRFLNRYVEMGLVQPLYNPERLAFLPEVNAYHARACQVKARDTAGLGWDLIPTRSEASEKVKAEIEQFLTSQLLPLTVILYRHQYDLEVIGHGGLEVVRAGYVPAARPVILSHIPGHTLRIHESNNKFAQKRGSKIRWFKRIGYSKDVDKDTGKEYPLGSIAPERRASEAIWNTLYSQRSDYYGVPDIIPALGAIHGDIARRDYNITFFDNFGVPAYAVFITGDFDPGEEDPNTGRTDLEEVIESHFSELAKNPHSTLILSLPSREGGEVKIQFVPLAVEVKDASFRLYRKDNRDEIISAHGVPPYRLGIAETGSLGGSTAKESTEIYKSSIVNPRQEILEALINQWIIRHEWGFATTDWAFKFREIDMEDELRDIEIAARLFDMGAMRIRDLIRIFGGRFGLEDDPDDPLLDLRFVKGQPLSPDAGLSQQATDVLKSLQEKLLREAVKYANAGSGSDGDGARSRAALALVSGAKSLGTVD